MDIKTIKYLKFQVGIIFALLTNITCFSVWGSIICVVLIVVIIITTKCELLLKEFCTVSSIRQTLMELTL